MHLLDIDQLRTFVAISDSGSFTRAADIVHKTQSAVSMQMKRLEERVGRAIFERDGRQSKLTDEGERLLDYARRIVDNAKALADGLMAQGFRLVGGGTDNHVMLIDFGADGVTGRAMQRALGRAGITANKNTVPRETRSAMVTSGMRLGSPALTTRGFGPDEMKQIAVWIRRVYDAHDDRPALAVIRAEVKEMASSFPVPGIAPAAGAQ